MTDTPHGILDTRERDPGYAREERAATGGDHCIPLDGETFAEQGRQNDFAAVFPGPPPLTETEAHQVIRRLARLDDEAAALRANYEALQRGIETLRTHILDLDGERLRLWTAAQLRGKRRSVRTLHGITGFRTIPARFVVEDEAAAVHYCLLYRGEAVSRRLNLKALSRPDDWAHLGASGELIYAPPPGVRVQPEETRFYVRSGGKGGGPESEETP